MKSKIEQRLQALEQRSDTNNQAPDVIYVVALTADGQPEEDDEPLIIRIRRPDTSGQACPPSEAE